MVFHVGKVAVITQELLLQLIHMFFPEPARSASIGGAKRRSRPYSLSANGAGTHDRLRQETAERVRKAAREAGYVPNQYARSLITKNKKVIGVIRLTDEPMATSFGFASTVDTYLNDMARRSVAFLSYNVWSRSKTMPLSVIITSKNDGKLCFYAIEWADRYLLDCFC